MPPAVSAAVGALMTSTWLNSVAGSVVKSGCWESIWSGVMKTSPFSIVPTCGRPRTLRVVPTPPSRLIWTPVIRCKASVIVTSGNWPMLSAEMLSMMLGARRLISMARIWEKRTPETTISSSSLAATGAGEGPGESALVRGLPPAVTGSVGLSAAAGGSAAPAGRAAAIKASDTASATVFGRLAVIGTRVSGVFMIYVPLAVPRRFGSHNANAPPRCNGRRSCPCAAVEVRARLPCELIRSVDE